MTTAALACPTCGAFNDAATGFRTDGLPAAGDVSVCAYCTAVSVFTGSGLAVRVPTQAELEEILAEPDTADAVLAVRSTIDEAAS